MRYQLEYPQLSEILYRALKPDPYFQYLETQANGDEQAQRQSMLAYYDYSMIEARQSGVLTVPERSFGVAVWSQPLPDGEAADKFRQKKDFMRENMGPACVDFYQDAVRFMVQASLNLIAGNAWYLSILAVAPEQQGNALGASLLTDTIANADKAGVDTYLETFTPQNMTFYSRLGYRSLSDFELPDYGFRYWLMRRPAASGHGSDQ